MARRTKKDALLTRSALLDAAECLFQERGVSRTSLADIARAAGVTRGAVYWHFKDKADLFGAMLERVTLPLEADMGRLLAAEGDLLQAWCGAFAQRPAPDRARCADAARVADCHAEGGARA